ncbi:hypothetical protein BZA77DRAFT_297670 [Pyronema omphalodes]|nr:hypothetical protein BZA77DRAFT_297670 [Pyronema omphalodes]
MSAIDPGLARFQLPPPNPTNKASPKPRTSTRPKVRKPTPTPKPKLKPKPKVAPKPAPKPKPKPKNPANPNKGPGIVMLPSSGDFPTSQPIFPPISPVPPVPDVPKTNPVVVPPNLNGDNGGGNNVVKTDPVVPEDGKAGPVVGNPPAAPPGPSPAPPPSVPPVFVPAPAPEAPPVAVPAPAPEAPPAGEPEASPDASSGSSAGASPDTLPETNDVNVTTPEEENVGDLDTGFGTEFSGLNFGAKKHEMDIERAIKCGCEECSRIYKPIPKGFVAPWNKAWVEVKKRPRALKPPGRKGKLMFSDANAPMGAKRLSVPNFIAEEDEESLSEFNARPTSSVMNDTSTIADTMSDTVVDSEMNIDSLVHDPGLTLKRQKTKTPKWLKDATIGEIERVTGGAIKKETFDI